MAREDRMSKYNPNNLSKEQKQEEVKTLGDKWEKKQKKPTMNQTHMRTSFLFRKDLKARLDSLAEYFGRGYRTEFINHFLEKGIQAEEERRERIQSGQEE